MAGEPILVVDDNPTNLRLIQFVLEKQGFAVRTATDAQSALTVLASHRPLLILTDLQMPGMDGLQLTRQLKADPATRDIVIVALTAYAMKGDEQAARAAGCDGYISKPIDTRTLGQTISDHLALISTT